MSGFFAVINFDGRPIQKDLLDRVRAGLSSVGANAQCSKIVGSSRNVGLAHAEFQTLDDTRSVAQPYSPDRGTWIVGDIRLDGRGELFGRLPADCQPAANSISDVELLLRAYSAWGEAVLDYIIGEFAFAIWDGAAQKLVCARDHLGTRPLFYACAGDTWIVTNVMDCLRLHPSVKLELDEFWVADFLIDGAPRDFDRTVYAAIKRLPAAHSIVINQQTSKVRRYWSLHIGEPVFYKRDEDCFDQFHALLSRAIQDRLPRNNVGLYLSGGLDSGTLAAEVARLARGTSLVPVGCCFYFKKLIDDDEKHFAALTAQHVGIQSEFRSMDDLCYDDEWWTRAVHTPEPTTRILALHKNMQVYSEMSNLARVWLYGEGPDNALWFDWYPYLVWLLRQGQWSRAAHDLALLIRMKSRREFVGAISRRLNWNRDVGSTTRDAIPDWIAPNLTVRTNYWERRLLSKQIGSECSWHLKALRSFNSGRWQSLFDQFDPGFTGVLKEVRHPYLDLRLLEFLVSLPAIPWCHRKTIIRRAMKGRLPDDVLCRDKTPLRSNPYALAAHNRPIPALDSIELREFVRPERIPKHWDGNPQKSEWLANLCALWFWLTEDRR